MSKPTPESSVNLLDMDRMSCGGYDFFNLEQSMEEHNEENLNAVIESSLDIFEKKKKATETNELLNKTIKSARQEMSKLNRPPTEEDEQVKDIKEMQQRLAGIENDIDDNIVKINNLLKQDYGLHLEDDKAVFNLTSSAMHRGNSRLMRDVNRYAELVLSNEINETTDKFEKKKIKRFEKKFSLDRRRAMRLESHEKIVDNLLSIVSVLYKNNYIKHKVLLCNR